MKKITFLSTLLLGLIYAVFGLNGFLHFLPVPEAPPEGAAFLGALFKTGYVFPIIKAIEFFTGIALLANKFKPLALVIVFPITVNIFLYHTILDPSGAFMAILLMALNLFLAWSERKAYAPLLKA